MSEAYWSAVRDIRLGIADQLESLDPQEWDAPSLCEGWRVRDVAGHVAFVPTIRTRDLMSVAPRVGFNPHRINTALAIRQGSRPPAQIVQDLRDHAGDRRTARVLDVRNSLFDVIVHSQDIATPLGRDFPVPVDCTRDALDRVWEMGWPFHAQRRLAGHTLTATDVAWTVGAGSEVRGSALALLLLLTGRTSTAISSLSGPGVAALRA
jgi:uncharacterized protein (TIGR03083 family)